MTLRVKLILLLISFMGALIWSPAVAIHLQDVYYEAGPGEGYDKLLVLDPSESYTGYLVVDPNVSCFIHGNGALIALDATGSISVGGQAKLDIDGCVIAGGLIGLNYEYASESTVEHCTIVDNTIGIRAWVTPMTISNCIIAHNSEYGIACLDYAEPIIMYNCMWANDWGDHMEFCPS